MDNLFFSGFIIELLRLLKFDPAGRTPLGPVVLDLNLLSLNLLEVKILHGSKSIFLVKEGNESHNLMPVE